jgi:hypothetical protein
MGSVPPACRGNLQEGVVNCRFFVNSGSAIGIIIALTSCVPLSRLRERGIVECGRDSFRLC